MNDFTRFAATASSAVIAAEARLAPVMSGLVAGTLLETAAGWRAVETLRIGDEVQTFDGGPARVLGLDRRWLRPEAEMALVLVPGGSFDACSDLLLVPGQHVLLDTQGDAAIEDGMFALIPALAMVGTEGARRHRVTMRIEVITPLFAEEELVFAPSGVVLRCPAIIEGAGRALPLPGFFARLDVIEAMPFLKRRVLRLAA